MYIDLNKTLTTLERCLSENSTASLKQAYRHTLRLQSQLLSVVYDRETFESPVQQEPFAREQSSGQNKTTSVVLTINEPLPSMKKLTESIEEHWKSMIHAAIRKAAQQGPLPKFEKAFVEIEIITPCGSNNARVWDTSNRAINVIINNLKGIFFRDDDMEHMAFSVVGSWG